MLCLCYLFIVYGNNSEQIRPLLYLGVIFTVVGIFSSYLGHGSIHIDRHTIFIIFIVYCYHNRFQISLKFFCRYMHHSSNLFRYLFFGIDVSLLHHRYRLVLRLPASTLGVSKKTMIIYSGFKMVSMTG